MDRGYREIAQAMRVERRRVKCENSLLYFTKHTFKQQFNQKFIVNWHHEMMCNELQDLVWGRSVATGGGQGPTEILIFNLPPRYGKTEIDVVRFIAWCIALNPMAKFIHTSFSDDLILHNSQQVKDVINLPCYREMWGVELSAKTDGKGEWYTTDGGGMYAATSRSTITGFGAGSTYLGAFGKKFGGAIIVDDPLKPADSRSDAVRGEVNTNFMRTIINRRNSRETPIILVMQRLHEDDLTGFIVGEGTGLRYRHIKIPALNENSQALWPYKHTADELLKLQSADPYIFSGQYQQEPAPLSGEIFKLDWIQYYDVLPDTVRFYGASDHATGEDKGDFTEHGMFGVDDRDNIYVVDWWYGQRNSGASTEAMLDMIDTHKPMAWAVEAGPIFRAIEPFMVKRMEERGSYAHVVPLPSVGKKDVRAQSIQGRFSQRKVFLPRGVPWVGRLVDQLMKFPNGKFDDAVDAFSLIGRMVVDMRGKKKPEKKPEPEFRSEITLPPLTSPFEDDE